MLSTIVSNAAYKIVFKMIDKEMDGELKNLIREKTIEVIRGIGDYHVFTHSEKMV